MTLSGARVSLPRLVSRSRAAILLGTHSTHISRLVKADRLRGVPIEGTADAYVLEEVLELAEELERERAERQKGATSGR